MTDVNMESLEAERASLEAERASLEAERAFGEEVVSLDSSVNYIECGENVVIYCTSANNVELNENISEQNDSEDRERQHDQQVVVMNEQNSPHGVLQPFPFICGFCHRKYDRIYSYFEHITSHVECKEEFFHICIDKEMKGERDQKEVFCCGMCDKVFKTVCHLHEHMICTEKVKKYIYDESSSTAYQANQTFNKESFTESHSSTTTENRKVSKASGNESIHKKSDKTKASLEQSDRSLKQTGDISKKIVVLTPEDAIVEDDDEDMANSIAPDKDGTPGEPDISDYYRVINVEITNNVLSGMYYESDDGQEDIESGMAMRDLEAFKQIEKRHAKLEQKRENHRKRMKQKQMLKAKRKRNESIVSSGCTAGELYVTGDSSVGAMGDTEVRKTDHAYADSVELTTAPEQDIPDGYVPCRTCGEMFKRRKLQKHEETHRETTQIRQDTGIPDGYVPCRTCGEMFKRRNLQKHEETHGKTAQVRVYKCKVCSKGFKTKYNLRQHEIVHSTEKNYTCDVCGKGFKTQASVIEHRAAHTALRNIPCPICQKQFTSKKILKSHMTTHSDVKAHVCDTCGKAFKRMDQLTSHKKTHSEVTPFTCATCGKAFKTQRDLNKHEKRHEPYGYVCPVCNKGFLRKEHMKRHVQTHLKNTAAGINVVGVDLEYM